MRQLGPRLINLMIGILNYGLGNLRSVQKAFERLGAPAAVVSRPQDLPPLDKLVLPGVGAFTDGMEHLRQLGLAPAIVDFVATGKPYLGICMGLQFLFERSQEDAPNQGLGLLGGEVVRFREQRNQQRIKVPHMGWNTLRWQRDDPLFAGLEQDAAVYFVHSYYAVPEDPVVESARCDYAGPFCASVWKDNLWATQFHPEKSQQVGLHILNNFARL